MNEFFALLLGGLLGFVIGIGVSPTLDKEAIEKFSKGPVCMEAKVGLDTIKKCYIIKETK